MRNILITLCLFLISLCTYSQTPSHLDWGDQGDGTYKNPILMGDYSDPDVVRIGKKWYMVASDFHFMGMQLLESDDMVNWNYNSQIYSRLNFPGYDEMTKYAAGSWAPALRCHDGKLWVFFCTPHEGLFMTNATLSPGKPLQWAPLHQVQEAYHWEDPCPFWDEDGKAYLGRSAHGAGPIILHRMSPDGRQLLDEGDTIYVGPVAEGTKIYKIATSESEVWYYLLIPEGGVSKGWQTALRSKNIYGPYERKVVLEQGDTDVNGPHQGGLVNIGDDNDFSDGQWWFYHFQHKSSAGRVVHLQPVRWRDGWPLMGEDPDGKGKCYPVSVHKKPMPTNSQSLPQTTGQSLPQTSGWGLQWQWNHNPVDSLWVINDDTLCLTALPATEFKLARNTFTQKQMGYEGEATVHLDFSKITADAHCGICVMGKTNSLLDVSEVKASYSKDIWLRVTFNLDSKKNQFYYSHDGNEFIPHGEPFFVDFGYWKGARWGIYHYTDHSTNSVLKAINPQYIITK